MFKAITMERNRNRMRTIAVAALILGTTGVVSTTFAQPARKSAAERRAAEEAITQQLAKSLNDILDNDGPAGLTARLVANDRKRIEPGLKKAYDDEYRKLVDEFHKTWEEKYGSKFSPEGNEKYINAQRFDYFQWQDRDFMSVTYEATQYDREAELRFMEMSDGNWQLQLSHDLSGEALGKRIKQSIKHQLGIVSQWPKKQADAYGFVTRNMLASLDYDQLGDRKKSD